MKKVFYIALTIFFLSGIVLFYLIDRNSETIKGKMEDKFVNFKNHSGIIITDGDEKLETIEKEFEKTYKGIQANISVGELRIEGYDGDKIKIRSLIPKKSLNNFSVEGIDNNIVIKASIANEIVVMVPKDIMLEGKIKMGVGDFYGENLKNVEIELNTGSLRGEGFSNVRKIKLDLGDLELNSTKNIERIELKTGSGKIEIIEQENNFSIHNNLGDLDISITNKFDGELNNKVKLGDISITNLKNSGKRFKGDITVDLGELNVNGID